MLGESPPRLRLAGPATHGSSQLIPMDMEATGRIDYLRSQFVVGLLALLSPLIFLGCCLASTPSVLRGYREDKQRQRLSLIR